MASPLLIGRLGLGINERVDLFGGKVEGQQSRRSAQVHGGREAAHELEDKLSTSPAEDARNGETHRSAH